MNTFLNHWQQHGLDEFAHVNAVDIADRLELGVCVVVELRPYVLAFDAHGLCVVGEKPPRAGALGVSRAGVMSTGGGMVGGGHLGAFCGGGWSGRSKAFVQLGKRCESWVVYMTVRELRKP